MILASLGGFGNKKKKPNKINQNLRQRKLGGNWTVTHIWITESKRIMLHVAYSVCSTDFRYLFADETRECTQSHG